MKFMLAFFLLLIKNSRERPENEYNLDFSGEEPASQEVPIMAKKPNVPVIMNPIEAKQGKHRWTDEEVLDLTKKWPQELDNEIKKWVTCALNKYIFGRILGFAVDIFQDAYLTYFRKKMVDSVDDLILLLKNNPQITTVELYQAFQSKNPDFSQILISWSSCISHTSDLWLNYLRLEDQLQAFKRDFEYLIGRNEALKIHSHLSRKVYGKEKISELGKKLGVIHLFLTQLCHTDNDFTLFVPDDVSRRFVILYVVNKLPLLDDFTDDEFTRFLDEYMKNKFDEVIRLIRFITSGQQVVGRFDSLRYLLIKSPIAPLLEEVPKIVEKAGKDTHVRRSNRPPQHIGIGDQQ